MDTAYGLGCLSYWAERNSKQIGTATHCLGGILRDMTDFELLTWFSLTFGRCFQDSKDQNSLLSVPLAYIMSVLYFFHTPIRDLLKRLPPSLEGKALFS